MTCSKCGGLLKRVETDEKKGGAYKFVRYDICKQCGEKFPMKGG